MKISLFVHDLSSNPIVRAAPFARACQKLGYKVEILGLLLSGNKVYEPYRTDFEYRTVRASSFLPTVLRATSRLAEFATGDIMYAFKPNWTTLWPAFLASRKDPRPLLMDVEDHEFWLNMTVGVTRFLKDHLYQNLFDAGALRYKLLMYPLAQTIPTAVTVSTRALQRQFGGKIVLHGPDTDTFRPEEGRETKNHFRRDFGLPQDTPLALFAGTPHPHKGLNTVVKALQHDTADSYHLVLAGNAEHPTFQEINGILEGRCHLLGFVPNDKMPDLLEAIDVVPVVQKRNSYTEAQMPAKLLEAMAMAKSVVASDVGDLGRVLGANADQRRGWIIEEGNPQRLAQVLRCIIENPEERAHREEQARTFVEKNASVGAVANRLSPIFEKLA
jgi:glycosyltransferase involved in cell wall biosynthesis